MTLALLMNLGFAGGGAAPGPAAAPSGVTLLVLPGRLVADRLVTRRR